MIRFSLMVAALGLAMPAVAQTPAADAPPASNPTPMAQRVVTVGILDKVSQATETVDSNPGKTITYRGLTITVRACEATPPWADQQFTGGFLQIDHQSRPGAEKRRVFSGWLYANTPSLNSFDHPFYDVWVSACKMEWPDTGPDTIIVN